jgi:uncharacterized protein YegP (UPF0339 family)
MDVVHFYQDVAGEWRWRRKSENGENVSESGEGYQNRSDCDSIARDVNGEDVEYVYDEDVT